MAKITIIILTCQATYLLPGASYKNSFIFEEMLIFRSQIARERSELFVSGEMHESSAERSGQWFRKLLLVLVLSLTWILLTGCEKSHDPAERVPPVCFEYHYINYAWGYQEHGWLIDRQGTIWSYDMPEDYISGSEGSYLTLEEMEHNLSLTDSVIGHVDQEELEQYLTLIPGAAAGEIGEASNIAADAGSSALSAYLFDPEEDAYRYVFLGMSGDWEQFNLSEEADSLISWLKEFGVFWISDW